MDVLRTAPSEVRHIGADPTERVEYKKAVGLFRPRNHAAEADDRFGLESLHIALNPGGDLLLPRSAMGPGDRSVRRPVVLPVETESIEGAVACRGVIRHERRVFQAHHRR